MSRLPENFTSLHQGEELIRSKSLEAIDAHDSLPHHFEMVEQVMTLFDHFSRVYVNDDEDHLVIQLLGIRLFNGTAAVIRLMLSGYYQAAVLQMRDLLEVSFLLDYFQLHRSQIAIWKTCEEGRRNKLFGAALIRKALDDRDGFTEKKREKHYKLLCNLGGHASVQGFCLVRPIESGLAHCGPFFAEDTLRATAEEMTRITVGAAVVFTQFFKGRTRIEALTKCDFQESQGLGWNVFMVISQIERLSPF